MTTASVRSRRWRLPDRSVWVTPETIYGTILTCAILAAAEDDVTDGELLVTVSSASMVLWAAHTFAVVMARHGARDGRETTPGQAASHAAFHSAGFLLGPALPIVLLGLGAANIVDDHVAYWTATSLGVAVIVAVGVVACIERRKRWYMCVLAGFVTGVVGSLVIFLSAVFEA